MWEAQSAQNAFPPTFGTHLIPQQAVGGAFPGVVANAQGQNPNVPNSNPSTAPNSHLGSLVGPDALGGPGQLDAVSMGDISRVQTHVTPTPAGSAPSSVPQSKHQSPQVSAMGAPVGAGGGVGDGRCWTRIHL